MKKNGVEFAAAVANSQTNSVKKRDFIWNNLNNREDLTILSERDNLTYLVRSNNFKIKNTHDAKEKVLVLVGTPQAFYHSSV